MSKHKPDCLFVKFHKSLTYFNPNGPDSQLTISEKGIEFDYNIHTFNKDIDHIPGGSQATGF